MFNSYLLDRAIIFRGTKLLMVNGTEYDKCHICADIYFFLKYYNNLL